MIMRVRTENKNMILLNVYRPPNKEDVTDHIVSTIKQLDSVYKDTPILIFGNLNYGRDTIEKKFPLNNRGFSLLYDRDDEAYTRYQLTKNGVEQSYLDYYITKNISNSKLYIQKPIVKSDHVTLRLEVYDDMKIMRQLKYVHSMKKVT
jgi:hypothetical protein